MEYICAILNIQFALIFRCLDFDFRVNLSDNSVQFNFDLNFFILIFQFDSDNKKKKFRKAKYPLLIIITLTCKNIEERGW